MGTKTRKTSWQDDKKFLYGLIGASFIAGAILVLILMTVLRARPTNIKVGPIDFELPTPKPSGAEPTSVNLVQHFDFATGLPKSVTLGICDNTPEWDLACREAAGRLRITPTGYTDQSSLGAQIEILPNKEQVYSLRLPVDPPLFVDAVSARVYVAEPQRFIKISLAARPKGSGQWVFSDQIPSEAGWLYYLIDLHPFKGNSGSPADEIAIEEIHFDMFIKSGDQGANPVEVWIDDVELYYPLAKPYKTGN